MYLIEQVSQIGTSTAAQRKRSSPSFYLIEQVSQIGMVQLAQVQLHNARGAI